MKKKRTAEKRLDLDATEAASGAITEDKTRDIYHALTIDEEFYLAICLTGVVEAYALRNGCPLTRLEMECPTAYRRAEGWVTRRVGCDVALDIILREAGREIGVHFARACLAPHQSRRPATARVLTTGASSRDLIIISTVLCQISIGGEETKKDSQKPGSFPPMFHCQPFWNITEYPNVASLAMVKSTPCGPGE
jgi:hypothetical protein